MYPNIEWILNTKGEIKKENYDACDALVCVLAYININRYGVDKPIITQSIINNNVNNETNIEYTMVMWGKEFVKNITLKKEEVIEEEN
jgi:hypothetical protein